MVMLNYTSTLSEFAFKNKGLYAVFIATMLTHPLEKIVFPHVFSKTLAAVSSGTGKSTHYKSIATIIGLWTVIQVVFTSTGLLDSVMVPKFLDFSRSRLITDIMATYETKYSRVMTGDLLSKIIKLPEALRDMFYLVHHHIVVDIVIHLCTIGYFYWLHPSLGHVYLAGIVVWCIINWRFYTVCGRSAVDKEQSQDNLHEEIEDVLQNLLSVYLCNKKDVEREEIEKFQHVFSGKLSRSLRCATRYRAMYSVLVVALFIGIVVTADNLKARKEISSETFVATFVVVFTAMGRMMAGFSSVRSLQHEMGVIASVEDHLNEIESGTKVEKYSDRVADKEMRNISFDKVVVNRGDTAILKELSATIQSGKSTAIIGRVGCGKSTLANVLMRLDDLDGGRIMYGDIDITTYSLEEWRKMFSYTPQHPKLRNKTLIENIRYAGADVTPDHVDAVLRESGLNHVADAFKPRYDKTVGVGGKSLSGGQRQIVWLMRSLFSKAPVVMLDEPTSALDPASRNDVMNLLKTKFKGRTMIIITHDPAVMKMVDTVLEMEGGKASVRENNRFTV
jgi:ABC-type multidrug transport system fused ATPase/permease subunit